MRHDHNGALKAVTGPRRPLSTPAGAAGCAPDWLGVASGFTPRGFTDFDGIRPGRFRARRSCIKSAASTSFATGASTASLPRRSARVGQSLT